MEFDQESSALIESEGDGKFEIFNLKKDFPQPLRDIVLGQDPELYPDQLSPSPQLYPNLNISLANIASLRGGDSAPADFTASEQGIKGNLRRVRNFCVVGLHATSIDGEEPHLDSVYLGASLSKVEENGTGVDKERPLKFVFNTDSQMPCIELFVNKHPRDVQNVEDPHETMSTTILPHQLALDKTGHVFLKCRVGPNCLGSIGGLETQTDNLPMAVDPLHLEPLAEAGSLVEIFFQLKDKKEVVTAGKDQWSSLNGSEFDAILAGSYQDSAKKATLNRDHYVRHLGDSKYVSIFVRSTSELAKQWIKRVAYVRDVMTICHHMGCNWFYKMQIKNAELDSLVYFQPELPKVDFKPPRWMGQAWSAVVKTDSEGVTKYSNVKLRQWASHSFNRQAIDPYDAAFLMKIGVEGELKRQARNLNKYVNSGSGMPFKGVFMQIPERNQMLVSIYIADDIMLEGYTKVPPEGTKLFVKIDKETPHEPQGATTVSLSGSVVTNIFDDGATFAAIVGTTKGLFGKQLAAGVEYPIGIEYKIDDVPSRRQLEAITRIAKIGRYNAEWEGPNLVGLIFGGTSNADKADALASSVTAEQHQRFNDALGSVKPKPNPAQREAIIDSFQSKSGLTLVHGPPGTGKTRVESIIALLHASVGRQVLVTAPTNGAMLNLANAIFKLGTLIGFNLNEIVVFNGASYEISSAERLQAKQEITRRNQALAKEEVDDTVEATTEGHNVVNMFAAMLTDADNLLAYERTFGYRLGTMMKDINASVLKVDEDVRKYAQVYSDARLKVHRLTDKKQRKACKTDLERSEQGLARFFLENRVKIVCCTLSTSSHPTLASWFKPVEVIIDEAANESLSSLATPLGTFPSIKHITLAGDHRQGKGVFVAADSNIGHKYIARNLFLEIAKDNPRLFPVFMLTDCYRMRNELVSLTSLFYNNQLKAHGSSDRHDPELVNTIRAWAASRYGSILKGSPLQLSLDVTGDTVKDSRAAGTTSRANLSEAIVIAAEIKSLLTFVPPKNEGKKKYRKIEPADIFVVTSYTGQRLLIQQKLREHQVSTNVVRVSTTKQAQGLEGDIVFYSLVVNNGKDVIEADDHLGLRFVADDHNFNVSTSRQRVARFIVGALRLLVQMSNDHHTQVSQYGKLFKHLRYLRDNGCVISYDQWRYVHLNGRIPRDKSLSFKAQLRSRQAENARFSA